MSFDVGIIGGGPAGASLATYLGKAGVSCVLFEKEKFPRRHVGESLVPSSTRVFKEIGFLEKMEAAKFPKKYGAVWTSHLKKEYQHDWEGMEPDCQVDVRFAEREQQGIEKEYTFHVDRGKFDKMLLDHAREYGCVIHEGVKVANVDITESGVSIHTENGIVKTKMIVDASGRNTFLGNKLRFKVNDPVFNQFALHTWFEDFDRGDDEKNDYIHVHFLPIENSWVWQIPISETITSFGIVTQKKNFPAKDKDAFFWQCIESRPELAARLKEAKQVYPLSAEGDYSYSMKHICGDRFVMIGDAARFVDPIFSSGVSVALNSARFASYDIIKAIETNFFSKRAFSNYETVIRRGTKNWYKFITLYYRLNVLFTAFISDPHYRLDIIKLLQGDVYDEEPAVLNKMEEALKKVENNPNHFWHKLLGNLSFPSYSAVG